MSKEIIIKPSVTPDVSNQVDVDEMLNTFIKTIEDKSNEIDEILKNMKNAVVSELGSLFKNIFEQNPFILEIVWTQYVPYFNDGDACEFSINEAFINGISVYNGNMYVEDYLSELDIETIEKIKSEIESDEQMLNTFIVISEKINKFLNVIDDGIMEDIFGSHSKVIVTKNGIDIHDYEHD